VTDSANNAIRSVEAGASGRVATLAAGLDNPQGIALDNRGFLWVADSGSHTIRKVSLSTGAVATVAGRAGAPGWVDGARDAVRFSSPTGVALETEPLAERLDRERKGLPPPQTSVIVADTGNGTLRRVRDDGTVETLRTSAASAAAGAFATFTAPSGVAVDPFGNIYVSEPDTDRVSALLRSGEVVQAVQPRTFSSPRGLAVAQSGKVVIAERNRSAAEIAYGEPRITSVTPGRISNKGGTAVTVKGKNFSPETVVIVAGTLIADKTIRDTETITFTVPVLQSGSGTVTVQNRGGIAQTSITVDPTPLRDLARGYITTVAGGSTFAGEGSRSTEVPMTAEGLALDSAGNLFIADPGNHRVRRVDARTGVVTTVAGNGQFVSGSQVDGVLATASPLMHPTGVAFDANGNLFIVDDGVRRVDARTGIITTVVRAQYGFCGDGGSALEACFNYAYSIAVDRSGNLYLDDRFNHRVRRVDGRTGIITTLAGNGQEAFSGDGGAASSAALNNPAGVAIDDARNALYIADAGNDRIRRVDLTTGVITTAAGGGNPADGIGDGGRATSARVGTPIGVAVDASGNLFITDRTNGRVRRVDVATAVITTVAGGGDGSPGSVSFADPWAIAVDSAGSVFVSELYRCVVSKVDATSGSVAAFAGNGSRGPLGDGLPAGAASLLSPRGVAFDAAGNIFITDQGNNRIRRIDIATGIITTAAGGGSSENGDGSLATAGTLSDPSGPVVFDRDGNFYIADTYGYRVRKVDIRTGKISTVAGTGSGDSAGDGGPATAAVMLPTSVALDGRGNLYIADEAALSIRKVDAATGIITKVAGGGKPTTGIGDGGRATQASLGRDLRIAVDATGNIFISDPENARVRKVDVLTQIITSVAGGGDHYEDGKPATSVGVLPVAVALDAAGNLYVSDYSYPGGIRRVSALTGIITTVAGTSATIDLGDNGPALSAFLYYPTDMAVDAAGNLYIADTDNDRIRAVRGPLP
jgi:sugar lactone lactonase YvrE